ncbi:S-adenosyl-L-methionine-dependent methyltransferase [Atractiella rhizophila]|nr:S-adenosyl-L-methionine-dependent methyltransferase [Atractiella rhizophila]KAH8924416.1 S-adenosyl-L-methionine-dependent methyltransferase [Atractiella rhizophila]
MRLDDLSVPIPGVRGRRDPGPKNILDIGCGTGEWVLGMAERYPQSQVIGVDIAPVQPERPPPNVEFYRQDANERFAFEDKSFDFVHIRFLGGGVIDWAHLLREVSRILRVGGLVSLCEKRFATSYNDTKGEYFEKFQASVVLIHASHHVAPLTVDIKRYLQQDGSYSHILQQQIDIPAGEWPQEATLRFSGRQMAKAIEAELDSLRRAYHTIGFTDSEIEEFREGVKEELNDRNRHVWIPFLYWVAMKAQ